MAQSGETSGSARAPDDFTSTIKKALREAKVDEKVIEEIINLGGSDFCIPLFGDSNPSNLSPSDSARFEEIQQRYLQGEFNVGSKEQLTEHFNLHQDAISQHSQMPRTLNYVSTIGRSNNTEVTEVTCSSGTYALKRIKRISNGKSREELEQMNYIKGELSILRKTHRINFHHFVRLIASYTDVRYVGMLLSPVADCNLARYLDNFRENPNPNTQLLEGFFGCLATALAHLHYVEHIRHKDIKPENILVKGSNVLLTDFGISLDWSADGVTTTRKEKMKTPKYCAPELDRDEPRNSKSDIWSLGCVFLEMFVVLKGKDRRYVDGFLGRDGPPKFCRSSQAIQDLIAELRADNTQCANKPLDWIEKMLQWKKEDRPNARILREEIRESDYCGICCNDDKIFTGVPINQVLTHEFIRNARQLVHRDRNCGCNQGAPKIEPSIPPEHNMEKYALTARVLLRYPHWREVEVIHVASTSACWISPDVLNDSALDRHNNATIESITLDGKSFKSHQYVEITCIVEHARSTLVERFCVATEATPFEMLVSTSTFNGLRQLGNTNG